MTWCNGYHGPTTVGIAWTDDFETFHQLENALSPSTATACCSPQINGRFAMLSRPSDNGYTAFGDISLESPDMDGRHRHVMSPAAFEVSAWRSA